MWINSFSKIYLAIIVSMLVMPATVLAHVKWFIDIDNVTLARNYSFSDIPVIVSIILFAIISYMGIILEKKLPKKSTSFRAILNFLEALAIPLFRTFVGLGLLLFSLKGYIFAPVYIVSSQFTIILSIFQMSVGLALILGIFREIMAISLFALYLMFSVNFGFLGMLETLEFIGIGIVLLVGSPSYFSLFRSRRMEAICQKYRQYSIPLLRVSIGINLIILGFTEKILNPELGVAFLQEHAFNFMPALGFVEYSDYWFVLSAGVVEVLFGTIFILGIITRLNALVLSLFFVTTLILLGPSELAGHIPHFAIMIMLLVFGSGERFKIMKRE